jgi:predicted HicB family RNase H-like nuclease
METPKIGKRQQGHVNKYINKAYDRINLTVPKGRKETIKAHADTMGESVNAFINRAINTTIEKDKEG